VFDGHYHNLIVPRHIGMASIKIRVHSIFTSVTHDLYRLLRYLHVEKNTINKLKRWNCRRLDFSIMSQINLAGCGGSVSNNGAIETDVKSRIGTLMEYKQAGWCTKFLHLFPRDWRGWQCNSNFGRAHFLLPCV